MHSRGVTCYNSWEERLLGRTLPASDNALYFGRGAFRAFWDGSAAASGSCTPTAWRITPAAGAEHYEFHRFYIADILIGDSRCLELPCLFCQRMRHFTGRRNNTYRITPAVEGRWEDTGYPTLVLPLRFTPRGDLCLASRLTFRCTALTFLATPEAGSCASEGPRGLVPACLSLSYSAVPPAHHHLYARGGPPRLAPAAAGETCLLPRFSSPGCLPGWKVGGAWLHGGAWEGWRVPRLPTWVGIRQRVTLPEVGGTCWGMAGVPSPGFTTRAGSPRPGEGQERAQDYGPVETITEGARTAIPATTGGIALEGLFTQRSCSYCRLCMLEVTAAFSGSAWAGGCIPAGYYHAAGRWGAFPQGLGSTLGVGATAGSMVSWHGATVPG